MYLILNSERGEDVVDFFVMSANEKLRKYTYTIHYTHTISVKYTYTVWMARKSGSSLN